MKNKTTILDENTRISLQTHNIWAILVSVVILVLSWANLGARIDLLNQKVDFLTKQQTELTQEFKDWKKQYEERLGLAEIGIAQLKSILKVQ